MSLNQSETLQRLFSFNLRPDTTLLPFQMPRMARDAPPRARKKQTLRVQSAVWLDKSTVKLRRRLAKVKFSKEDSASGANSSTSGSEVDWAASEAKKQPRAVMKYVLKMVYSARTDASLDVMWMCDESTDPHTQCALDWKAEHYSSHALPPGRRRKVKVKIDEDDFNIMAMLTSQPDEREEQEYRPHHQLVLVLTAHMPGAVERTIYYARLEVQQQAVHERGAIGVAIDAQKSEYAGRAYLSQDIYGLACTVDPYTGQDNVCVVCMTMPRQTVLLPCRHLCLCRQCAVRLLAHESRCPVCRTHCSATMEIPPVLAATASSSTLAVAGEGETGDDDDDGSRVMPTVITSD